MKTIKLTFISLCLLLLTPQIMAAPGQLKTYKGKLINPDFKLSDMQGNSKTLADYRGNIVLLQFWATYCTPCRKEMPTMNNLIKKMQGRPFKIVTINMAESTKAINHFIDEVPVDFPVLQDTDGTVLNQWKVFAAPANFILDKQGKILFTLYGGTEWDSDDMVRKLSILTDL